jgi:type IV pilus assembly protein PilY1
MSPSSIRKALPWRVALCTAAWFGFIASVQATTPLADQPLFTNTAVPGNLVLALSVEFPTAVSVAHIGGYNSANRYLGYFDPDKCYLYHHSATESQRHFYPSGLAVARQCTGGQDAKWSGNFLNWATMQTIDPFRWALTGGYRVVDTADTTIIEKAWASGQGGTGNFPNRSLTNATVVANATPFTGQPLNLRVQGLGNRLRFTGSGDINTVGAAFNGDYDSTKVYEVSVRVKVCDASAAAGGLESNCRAYPSGHHKPEGLIQQYAERMRFSAFGYLNDSNLQRDGGVLRAAQKFVGPTRAVPGSTPVANPATEWDATTGVMHINPDATDASTTAALWGVPISNSGVLNYLNKFGQITPGSYKTYDPVGELYYAALRYLRNLGDVNAWSTPGGANAATRATWADGFPVITPWVDPVQYSCQRNFVLGIGDVNTHADKNVPGNTGSASEPAKPPEVQADTAINAVTLTNKVGSLQGIANLGTTSPYGGCCTNNSALMAGLAWHANTHDIRPDLPGKQTVQTYWLDVLEFSTYKPNNQFYLAAKYGGFKTPAGFDPATWTGALPTDWWHTTGETVGSGGSAQQRPDTYFTAAQPDQLVAGLQRAFASIAAQLQAFTTSFSTSLPQVSIVGNTSFSALYDSENWTGEVVASELSFDPNDGTPSQTVAWSFAAKLSAQLAGSGWDNGRRVLTWNPATSQGVPFRHASLSAAQRSALSTPWRTGDDSADVLNYLRGQRLHEQDSTATGSSQAYRKRTGLLGDVVGSKARPVGPPSLALSNASNPGYGSFKAAHAARPTMVYVGANDGMLHAIDGRLSGAGAGNEIFAYVPSALFAGPGASPALGGLAGLTNPDFEHRYFVNATPAAFDIDFGRTPGGTGTDWRTVLIGGLGKGGRSLYALDITDPSAMTTESTGAARVLWEFSDPDLGFTYGEPLVVKTRKYGWVVIIGSGYNNADGQGRLFIINPRTGALLEKISTGEGSAGAQAGLAHVNAFTLDRTDGTVDAAYAGDLLGNLWRLDLTGETGAYPAPLKLATLRSSGGGAVQPVTTRPLIEVDPRTGRRFVLLGTGRMLDTSDIGSTVQQSFYAIVDGTATRFNNGSLLPPGVAFPITRAALADNTNLLDGISYDLATQIGWTIELGNGGPGALGWRVTSDPSSAFGLVTFASTLPSGEACNPSGSTRIYAVNFGTGRSVLTSGPDAFINYSTAVSSVVTDLRFFTVGGTPRLIAGSDTGELASLPGNYGARGGVRRLNWRELPVAN